MNPLIALQGNGGFNPMGVESQLADIDYKRANTNALMMQERARQLEYQKAEAAQQEAQRQQAGYNALLARIPQGADMTQRANLLIQGGYQKQGLDLLKGVTEAGELGARGRKHDADTGKMSFEQAMKAQEYLGQASGALLNDPMLDASKVAQSFRQGASMGILPPAIVDQRIAELQALQTPQQVREFVSMMHNASKSLQQQSEERRLQTIQTNNGDSNTITAFNPYTGKSEVVSTTKINQSPDNLANNTTKVSEGAADRAQSAANSQRSAGATLGAAAMARDAALARSNEKPIPPAALKMLEDSRDAVAGAKGTQDSLTKIIGQIDKKAINLGPVANKVGDARNALGMSNEQSRNYASLMASLEKLRNDSLRLNKGVQTDGDAQRAWNELLVSVNDPKVVRQRLSEIIEINKKAEAQHAKNSEAVNRNYGRSPEISAPAATNPGSGFRIISQE